MTITKELSERIEVNEDGTLQVAEVTKFLEEGKVVARSIHRKTVEPGGSVDAVQNPRAAAIATVVHTPQVVAAFRAKSRPE